MTSVGGASGVTFLGAVCSELREVEATKFAFLISEPLGTEPLVDGPYCGDAVRVEVGLP